MEERRKVLLTGCTGYVGGRLIPILEQRSEIDLRCLARNRERVLGRVVQTTEIFQGDVSDSDSLGPALEGVHTAYYLIHRMGMGHEFEQADRDGARNFARAAKVAGVKRIIYLGGLGNDQEELSPHLRSRHEVGQILKESGAEVIEFRASIIIGSGSLSFELVRALVNKLPVMVWPKWVSTLASPIAIEDVLEYLCAVLEHPVGESRIYEIGGPEEVSYGGIMQEYARQRGLIRLTVPLPFVSPKLSSLWLGLVTPVYSQIGRELIESVRNPTTVKENSAREDFSIQPRGLSESISRALSNEDQEFAKTRWSDAVSSAGDLERSHWGGVKYGTRLVDSRSCKVSCAEEVAFRPIQKIGGKTGWYYANFLWRLRGVIDLMVGGVGLRRGRRSPVELQVGDVLDCWRVEELEPGRLLRLYAEMKLPGRAWLEFEVSSEGEGSRIRQTALFDPIGLWGLVYWYAIWPLHQLIFAGMLRNIAREAERLDTPEKNASTVSKSDQVSSNEEVRFQIPRKQFPV